MQFYPAGYFERQENIRHKKI